MMMMMMTLQNNLLELGHFDILVLGGFFFLNEVFSVVGVQNRPK